MIKQILNVTMLFAVVTAAVASEETENPEEAITPCFCLVDEQDDTRWWDCVELRRDFLDPIVRCRSTQTGERILVEEKTRSRESGGEGGCTQCRLEDAQETKDPLRGDDDVEIDSEHEAQETADPDSPSDEPEEPKQ